MKKILVSWIGAADLKAHTDKDMANTAPGPLLSALNEFKFASAALIYNYPDDKVEPYLKWIQSQIETEITSNSVSLNSPVDFQEVFKAANDHLNKTKRQNPNASVFIHLSPGTPTMAAIWILLGKTRYQARFIQSSQEEGAKEIEIPFDISAEFVPLLISKSDSSIQQIAEAPVKPDSAFDHIVTQNPQLKKLKHRASQMAQRNLPVLIIGETGTGKELFARAIHNASPRCYHPFLVINCGAIPDQLIDSTLFGYAKGAFTGANADKKGYFEEADGGTLFLDEFGELPLHAQVRLLRILQDGTLNRVGDTIERKVDVRIIAATNKDLVKEVFDGRFREDLYYRVAIGILQLPPLRERTGDFGLLCDTILENINKEAADQPGYKQKKISIRAKNIMLNYHWPGNIRELHSTILRASLWTNGEKITEEAIAEAMFQPPSSKESVLYRSIDNNFKIQDVMKVVAKHYIGRALKKNNGNKTKAAEDLGLSNYQTLSNWMTKYGIEN